MGRVCRQMEAAFRQGQFEAGLTSGIQAVTRQLVAHFPAAGGNDNELPDKAVVL